MKKIISCSFILFLNFYLTAQTPQKISYQAVVRDATNSALLNRTVGMKVSILVNNINGAVVYSESHQTQTNNIGVITIEIGAGQVLSGTFNMIDWSIGSFFLKTETDINGGSNYLITGTSQLLSVPFAFYAQTAERLKDPFYGINRTLEYPEGTKGNFVIIELSLENPTYTVPVGFNLYLSTLTCNLKVNGIAFGCNQVGLIFHGSTVLTFLT